MSEEFNNFEGSTNKMVLMETAKNI